MLLNFLKSDLLLFAAVRNILLHYVGSVNCDLFAGDAAAVLIDHLLDETFYIDDETRAKMSAAKKGKPSPKRGVPISAEQRAKISAGRRGLKMSEEHNLKRSRKMQGERNHMHGKRHSPETKQKIAEAAKRREEAKRLAHQSP